MTLLFYISIFIIVYTYLVYPFLLSLFSKNNSKLLSCNQTISIIIPAYNEIACIENKILNTIALCKNLHAQIILVTDGSNDGTENFSNINITHLHHPIRKGKPDAINNALAIATGEIFIFTDANTILSENSFALLLQHFSNQKIGAVCGEKSFTKIIKEVEVENFYWRFESTLKQNESSFYTVVGAAGELFAVRKSLVTKLPNTIILDDFYISMLVAKQKFLIAYEKNAKAFESPSLSLQDEYQRRVRIASGVMQWLCRFGIKDFWHYNIKLKWQFFSHRLCRWIFAPLALIGILFACIFEGQHTVIFHYILYITLSFILIGYLINSLKIYNKLFYFTFYFFFVHYCFLIGYLKYFFKLHNILWTKAKRM